MIKELQSDKFAAEKECEELNGLKLDSTGSNRVTERRGVDESLLCEDPNHVANHRITKEKTVDILVTRHASKTIKHGDDVKSSCHVLHNLRIETEGAQEERIIALPAIHKVLQLRRLHRSRTPLQNHVHLLQQSDRNHVEKRTLCCIDNNRFFQQ